MTIQQNHPGNILKIDSWTPASKILMLQVWAGTRASVSYLPGNSDDQLSLGIMAAEKVSPWSWSVRVLNVFEKVRFSS